MRRTAFAVVALFFLLSFTLVTLPGLIPARLLALEFDSELREYEDIDPTRGTRFVMSMGAVVSAVFWSVVAWRIAR